MDAVTPGNIMRAGRLVPLAAVLATVGLIGPGVAPAQAGQVGTTDPAAPIEAAVLDALDAREQATFWVVLDQRADLRTAAAVEDWAARGTEVLQELTTTADTSQAGLRDLLADRGADFQPFWIINAIRVTGDEALVREIAARPEVSEILASRTYEIPERITAEDPPRINAVEWGLDRIGAPDVWDTFNVRGEGIVVGVIDTGAAFNHPAIVGKYRGNLGNGSFDHNYNWHDPSNVCGTPSQAPCDNNGHGTHVTGTVVGDDGGSNQIGVAPEARWISAKGCELNTCSDTALLSSGEFMLAPTDLAGEDPRPDLRPHVVNNSWGGEPDTDPFYQAIVESWEAAGIFTQFSNGNTDVGQAPCASASNPGNLPESYAAGAFDINNNIAVFSNRGPSAWPGDLIKPNISAPGVAVRSSIPGGGYAAFSGTSMASPHVAGSVALLWSAAPELARDLDATRDLLDRTAIDVENLTCGGTAQNNNVWGQGRLDIFAAVNEALGGEPPEPAIEVTPESLSAEQTEGEVTEQTLTIGNTGGSPLDWSIAADEPQPPTATSPAPETVEPQAPAGDNTLATKRRLLGSTFGSRPATVVTPESAPAQEDEVTITHSASQSILALNSVACSPDNGLSTTENGYLRHFALEDFDITGEFDVTEVSFAIEDLTAAETVTVNLFTMVNPAGPFTYANFQEVGSADVSLSPQAMTLVSVPVTGQVPAGGTLVVEVDVPDMSGLGGFFIGSNPNGQTAPSYLRSASCGLPEPTDTAAIGFPGMHVVMNVTGTTEGGGPSCEVPSSTPWVDVDPLSGAVAPGGGQVVDVTFDSTGLSAGDVLEANLCLESNDPDEPLVSVPLTLEVTDGAAPVIEVTPDSLSAEQTEGEVTEQTLTIGNVGSGTLDWEVFPDESAPPTGSASGTAEGEQGMTLGTNPGGEAGTSAVPDAAPLQAGETTISHSASQAIAELNSVACGPGGGLSTENGYLRHFVLEDFEITSDFEVNEVSFGVETINGPPHPVTVNLFTMINPTGPFTYANFELIGSAEQELLAQTLTMVSVPVTGTAPAGATLVVEVETPDMSGVGGGFFIGSNADGQTAPSYLRSASCGLPEPLDTAAIGFPGMHIVMNVTGTADGGEPAVCDQPGDVPWLSVSPESGSTAAGESSEVTVSFDSTGLEVGDHEAVLCVSSNDPLSPLVQVPVSLSVVEDGGEPVVCDETITGTRSGPLTVDEGVTCLAAGSRVLGEVNVLEGAGLIATAAVVQGPISAFGATVVEVVFSQVTGPVLVSGASGSVSLFASQVTGSVSLLNNAASSTVSGNTIIGSLSCFGNSPAPIDHGLANTATGGKLGQCAEL